jgi:hypothetical protein
MGWELQEFIDRPYGQAHQDEPIEQQGVSVTLSGGVMSNPVPKSPRFFAVFDATL